MHIVRNIEYRGGAEEFVMRLLDEQIKEHSVSLCCIEGVGKVAASFKKRGVSVYDIPLNWAIPLSTYKIIKLIKEKKYDIIHTHLFNADAVGAIIKELTNRPVISTKYCMFSRAIENNTFTERVIIKPIIDNLLERIISSGISEIHAVSSEVQKKWSAITNVPVYVMPCAPRDYSYGINTKYNSEPHDLILGTLSRLVPEKGIDLGIKIIEEIKKAHPILWKIAGEGYLNDRLHANVLELGLEKNVEFLGKVDDTQGFLTTIDVYFHPSRTEGLPIAIQEAMFSRKPIIASDVGGIPDLIIPGCNGVLINPYDAIGSSSKIARYITDRNLIVCEGENSRQRAEAKFSFNNVYKRIIQSYKRVMRE